MSLKMFNISMQFFWISLQRKKPSESPDGIFSHMLFINPSEIPNYTADTFSDFMLDQSLIPSYDQQIWEVRPTYSTHNNHPHHDPDTCISIHWSGSFPFSRQAGYRWAKLSLCWIFFHKGWKGPEHNNRFRFCYICFTSIFINGTLVQQNKHNMMPRVCLSFPLLDWVPEALTPCSCSVRTSHSGESCNVWLIDC